MDHTTDFGEWPHLLTRTMTVLSTLVNPMLYLLFSVPVKKAFVRVCTCWRADTVNDFTEVHNAMKVLHESQQSRSWATKPATPSE